MLASKAVVAFLCVNSAFAHSIFQKLWVNGVDQGQDVGIRVPDYNGPITDVTSNDIICNGGINPLHTPLPTAIINVPAGASVTAEWHHGGNGPDPSDASDPIDPSHKGPIMAYLAKVPSALQTDVTGLGWFKIYEDGMHSDGTWAVDTLISNAGKVTFTIPTCIPNGNYLLRVELIALHGASSYPGAQFYMECAQINIINSQGSSSPATVSFPGAYSGSDPGVLVNIYYPPLTSYTIPGPRPFTCSGSGSSSSSTSKASSSTKASSSSSTKASSSSSTKASSSTSSTKASSSSSSKTSSAAGSGQTLYGQCGGSGWTGATTCAQGTCTYSNEWYSQCL